MDLTNTCVICSEKINFNKEAYVRLTDFTGRKQTGQCFYHLQCWKNRFQITQEKIQKDAGMWIEKLQGIAKSISEGKSETTIEI